MFKEKIENNCQEHLEKSIVQKLKIHFVCDECCLPVSLYGENIILTVKNDKLITHIFCDLHAEEFLNEK